MKSFTPCSDNCPAVTGKPLGSVQYCPMQEHERHRSLNVEDVDPDIDAYPLGKHPTYDHADYTDCCANWQCCIDFWQELGMLHVAADLLRAVDGGTSLAEYPLVYVKK